MRGVSAGTISTSRRFFFAAKRSRASGVKDGATMASTKSLAISSAAAASTSRLMPMTPTEGGDGIGLERSEVGLEDGGAGGGSAGVGVLDDDDGGLVELADQLPAGVEIDDVVVAKLFALELLGGGDALAAAVGVERGLLVRILAVAERLRQRVDDADRWRQIFLREDRRAGGGFNAFERGRDACVVGSGDGEGRFGQPPAGGAGQAAGVGGQLFGQQG